MEEILAKVIKRAYELQFVEHKSQINTAQCVETDDELERIQDIIRNKWIPNNDVISFMPATRFAYIIRLNPLKESLLKKFYEGQISIANLLNPTEYAGGTTMNFNNNFNSYDNSTQNIKINYNIQGNWNEVEKSLKSIDVSDDKIAELKQSIEEDKKSNGTLSDNLLVKTKETARKMIAFIIAESSKVPVAVATKILLNALTNYFGFPVQF